MNRGNIFPLKQPKVSLIFLNNAYMLVSAHIAQLFHVISLLEVLFLTTPD